LTLIFSFYFLKRMSERKVLTSKNRLNQSCLVLTQRKPNSKRLRLLRNRKTSLPCWTTIRSVLPSEQVWASPSKNLVKANIRLRLKTANHFSIMQRSCTRCKTTYRLKSTFTTWRKFLARPRTKIKNLLLKSFGACLLAKSKTRSLVKALRRSRLESWRTSSRVDSTSSQCRCYIRHNGFCTGP